MEHQQQQQQQQQQQAPITFESTTRNGVQHRKDPLTGIAVRMNPARASRPKMGSDPNDTTLQSVLQRAAERDPFAPAVIFDKVPKFQDALMKNIPADKQREGRVVQGDTVLFPNLNPFGDNHAVGAFCKESYLAIPQFTSTMLVDCLEVVQYFINAVQAVSGERYPVLMWNYMPPSAGSIIHPHVQVLVEAEPLPQVAFVLQRGREYLSKHGRSYWADLVSSERGGQRWVGQVGSVAVLTSFAPRGFTELLFVVQGTRDIAGMTTQQVHDFVDALLRALKGYHALGIGSFNLVSFSGATGSTEEDGHCLYFKIFSRPNPTGLYTNDTGPTERMYDTWVIDTIPELVAESMRPFFAT